MASSDGPHAAGTDSCCDEEDSSHVNSAESLRQQGNALLTAGDLSGACRCYDEGLAALRVLPDKVCGSVRTALHLNAALVHLKRDNLASVVDHSTEALKGDPHSVKALFRRGSARARLAEQLGHSEEASLARADLERALELDPTNAEVRHRLQALRAWQRGEDKKHDEASKATFKGLFDSNKPLYTVAKPEPPAPVIRRAGGEDRALRMRATGLKYNYVRGVPVLNGVDMELRAGRCLGMFGNNASGKSTIIRLLSKKLHPTAGNIDFTGLPSHSSAFSSSSGLKARILACTSFLLDWRLAAFMVVVLSGLAAQSLFFGCGALALFFVATISRAYLGRASAPKDQMEGNCVVVHLTSEDCDREPIGEKTRIERMIGDAIPGKPSKEERDAKVVLLLAAAGFQMFDQTTGEVVGTPEEYVKQGILYGKLSGGQKHLMHVLRGFARRPDVLLGDELLGGLDVYKQPRVLHMLRRLLCETNMALLYSTTELHQLRIIADSVCFLGSSGLIVELGTADDVLESPKHPESKEYVSAFRGLPGGATLGGKLGEAYAALREDPALAADWLPAAAADACKPSR